MKILVKLRTLLYHIFVRIFRRELIRDVFRGVLGRELKEEEIDHQKLLLSHGIDRQLHALCESEEAWEKIHGQHSGKIIKELYAGVLEREPEQQGLHEYRSSIKEKGISGVVKDLVRSGEFCQKTLKNHSKRLIELFYLGILGRSADPEGLRRYQEKILEDSSDEVLRFILDEMSNSKEKRERILSLVLSVSRHPSSVYHKPAIVFIHIQKTAGTSLQNMLKEIYKSELYSEHSDSLHLKSPSKLTDFNVFLGHFNYDSLRYIHRKDIKIITFFREPKSRLISLYNFLRSHQITHPIYKDSSPLNGARLANEFLIHDFFRNKNLYQVTGFWNHMTWSVIGGTEWKNWNDEFFNSNIKINPIEFSESKRLAIREKLNEFFFIGIQENFEKSCVKMFSLLGKSWKGDIRFDHSVEKIAQIDPHIKKIPKQGMDEELSLILENYVFLDKIVYEEALKINANFLAE